MKKSRQGKEKWKVWENVFDKSTELTIQKLISKSHFDGLTSPLSIGKESNVFLGKRKGEDIIVKIYRVQSCNFNKMFSYIAGDSRYQGIKPRRRQVIFSWVQREFKNIFKARQGGVAVPKPISMLDNVILMEQIGKSEPSLKLKDDIPKNPQKFLKLLLKEMSLLDKAGLVHGDLSEFNILNLNQKPVLIDFSQCTTKDSANTEELLERDAINVARFFTKLGAGITAEEILEHVNK